MKILDQNEISILSGATECLCRIGTFPRQLVYNVKVHDIFQQAPKKIERICYVNCCLRRSAVSFQFYDNIYFYSDAAPCPLTNYQD